MAPSSLQGEQKPLLEEAAACSAEKSADNKSQSGFSFLSFFFFFLCFISPGHLHAVAWVRQLVDQVSGQKGWGGNARRVEEEAASCRCHNAGMAWQGCGAPPPLVGAPLSWQPDSASVKTRYRNVLWVTFKTRYKSSAL